MVTVHGMRLMLLVFALIGSVLIANWLTSLAGLALVSPLARLSVVRTSLLVGLNELSPHELAVRVDDARPKVLITASCGIEFTKIRRAGQPGKQVLLPDLEAGCSVFRRIRSRSASGTYLVAAARSR